jgi:hypothetical protein
VLNNRQIAILLWAGVALVYCVAAPKVRPSLAGVLRIALHPKIWSIIVILAAWSVGLVYVGSELGWWTDDLASDTWFWFFTTALVLLFNFEKASAEPDFFIRKAKETFGLTLVLGFLSDLYVLSVPFEFIAQGLLAVVAMLAVVAGMEERTQPVRKLADGCLSAVGLLVLSLAVISLIQSWSTDDLPDLARQLLMPAWMTLGVLPLIYAIALYAAYENIFLRVDWKSEGARRQRLRAKTAVVIGLHGRATLVGKFTGMWPIKLADAPTFREALGVTDEFEAHLEDEERERQEAEDRLVRYAGVDGEDEEGLRLDRREFEETTSALRWIATCQMGWGRRETGYRADILEVVGDLSRHGLPADGDIQVALSASGESWYAWRRTVSGWVFAIGAATEPPDQWEFDGPKPPGGFPGESADWGPGPFMSDTAPNW